MKRFVIPALFVVDAEDMHAAEATAALMQSEANNLPLSTEEHILFLDEERRTYEIQIHPDDTELPHTYNPN